MLHIIKLCVGIGSVEELEAYRDQRDVEGTNYGRDLHVHRTRAMPRRADEIVGLGSLYWVIGGAVRCRQPIVALEAQTDHTGRSCCDIVMSNIIVRTRARPKRAFQGWRYLEHKSAPADLLGQGEVGEGDERLARELADLGLI